MLRLGSCVLLFTGCTFEAEIFRIIFTEHIFEAEIFGINFTERIFEANFPISIFNPIMSTKQLLSHP